MNRVKSMVGSLLAAAFLAGCQQTSAPTKKIEKIWGEDGITFGDDNSSIGDPNRKVRIVMMGECLHQLDWNADGDRYIAASEWKVNSPPNPVPVDINEKWKYSQKYCDTFVGRHWPLR